MIHLILGRQGGGKTLLTVAKAYEAYQQGKTIYSNVHLKFPYNKLNYKDIVDCKLEDGVVILDEVHQLLPARNSLSLTSREICDGFLSMVRKKKLTIYGTTQTERKVDVRFRDELDFLYICKKYAFDSKSKRWVEVLHNQDLSTDIPIMIQADVFESFSNQWAKMSIYGNKFYKMYDTRQIIRITGL